MNNLDTLREQVLALPEADRERLMEDILVSFSPADGDAIDKAWADEIESRRQAYLEGRIPTVTLEDSRRRLGL